MSKVSIRLALPWVGWPLWVCFWPLYLFPTTCSSSFIYFFFYIYLFIVTAHLFLTVADIKLIFCWSSSMWLCWKDMRHRAWLIYKLKNLPFFCVTKHPKSFCPVMYLVRHNRTRLLVLASPVWPLWTMQGCVGQADPICHYGGGGRPGGVGSVLLSSKPVFCQVSLKSCETLREAVTAGA